MVLLLGGSWAKKYYQKMKIFLDTSNLLPIFSGGFQVENLMRRVQNLIFLGAALIIDLGNQFKAVFACKNCHN